MFRFRNAALGLAAATDATLDVVIRGRDRFRPQVFVDAEGRFSRVSMTIRLRASGC